MKKVILNLDESTMNLTDNENNYIGVLPDINQVEELKEQKDDLVLNLIKQGVTAEEVIKLKNSDVI